MKNIFLAFLLSASICSFGQKVNIIPEPASIKVGTGSFTITPATKIIFEASGVEKAATFLNQYLKEYYGFELKSGKEKSSLKNTIVFNFDNVRQ